MHRRRILAGLFAFLAVLSAVFGSRPAAAEELRLQLRYRQETHPDSGRHHTLVRNESWRPAETALIVCDVWDSHHCLNAVRRVEEFAPRLNDVVRQARQQRVTIIHAPSGCMATYADHPARQRAIQTPRAASLPADIGSWCTKIPAEENGVYPIDQSDGGEDDDPEEHAQWAAKLTAMGRNPRAPWTKQYEVVAIDPERDFISDRGEEVWSILEQRGIKNVILTGVHTNMCVLGRPFGLRQMAKNGKHVVLVRDLTDTMYNPASAPYVSHFTGTDLIVAHIEKYVCPTITSGQLLGDGTQFRFSQDRRPHVVIVMAEDEYQTERTLPQFALDQLGKDFRVSYVFGSDTERNDIPGLEVLNEADVALISVRRRPLRTEQLALVRTYVQAGKPVLGLRTASHAFCLRNQPPPAGTADWPEFDPQVFGGNYTNHYGNQLQTTIRVVEEAADHALLRGVDREPFVSGGSLYKVSPLAAGTTPLLNGRVEGQPEEPVAWTFARADGGWSFYSSLGHVKDFEQAAFVRLLRNAVYAAARLPLGSAKK
jgi:nicotinamidase-related amidase/type 1 glutamine amidotransferase